MSATPPSGTVPGPSSYAGQRLGLPEQGRGSVAGWGRRVAALFVDWIASILVAGAVAGQGVMTSHGWESWVPMLVFLVVWFWLFDARSLFGKIERWRY